MKTEITEAFGNIDIYLFDQLQKGKFDTCKTILDAGCGAGRNIYYFLKNKYNVYGVDQRKEAIQEVQKLASTLSPDLTSENFLVASLEDLPFNNDFFDVVICSAVLHFANDHNHFENMLTSLWRVIKTKGYLFCRLASNIGIESLVKPLENGRYLLPDGSERYLVDEQMLIKYAYKLNGELFEPIKTTNVQNMRCMTTWCLQKKELHQQNKKPR